MTSWWQHLPKYIDPIAFSIGFFDVRFYSLSWILGFFAVWLFLSFRVRRDGCEVTFRDKVLDILPWIFFGAMLGGRLGYAALYAPSYFWQHPLHLFIPFENGVFIGFFGMSFFGGAIGVIAMLWLLSRKTPDFFLRAVDYYALSIPIALFFGRMGNFFNGELFGRVTSVPWGMYFLGGGDVLRHPSQLYEAFFEGVVLFFLLFLFHSCRRTAGMLGAAFLFGYGFFRVIMEFFREPDFGDPLFLTFSLGQWYGFFFLIAAFILFTSILSISLKSHHMR